MHDWLKYGIFIIIKQALMQVLFMMKSTQNCWRGGPKLLEKGAKYKIVENIFTYFLLDIY